MPKVSTGKRRASKRSSSAKETDLSGGNGTLSEYELKRLKRIEENKAVLKSLNIIQAKEELHQLQRHKTSNTNPTSRKLKPKVASTPLPSRRSLRLQERINEYSIDQSGPYRLTAPVQYIEEHPGKPDGPLDTVCVNYVDTEIEQVFRRSFLSSLKNSSCNGDQEVGIDVDLWSLRLHNSQITKVTKDRIFSLAIAPVTDKVLVLAGDKWGKIGIWDVEDTKSDHLGVYMYEPHSRPVSAIVFDQTDAFFSTSYDGSLRACNLEKGVFELVMKLQDECLTACTVRDGMLLVGVGNGSIVPVDHRQSNTTLQQWKGISTKAIKCISINPVNDNYFASSSSDATVGIWDVRNLRTTGSLRALVQKIPLSRTVTSAYYDPINGTKLLTTSLDDQIRVFRSDTPGSRLQVLHQWYHNNHVGRWLTNFQATWDPKCDYRFVCGSMSYPRQVDIYSIQNNERSRLGLMDTLQTSVCSLVKFHPSRGALIGANSSGKVFVWK